MKDMVIGNRPEEERKSMIGDRIDSLIKVNFQRIA